MGVADIEWERVNPQQFSQWESLLVELKGHPLQSVLWGEARRIAEDIEYSCLIAREDDHVCAMARVENRKIKLIGSVAWIPKGPVVPVASKQAYIRTLVKYLKKTGFILYACDPWQAITDEQVPPQQANTPMTIWIDLSVGRERLLRNLNKQWRYGMRKAYREGVTVEQTRDRNDVAEFYNLCHKVSDTKGFKLPASQLLMESLIELSEQNAPVEPHLFVAKYDRVLCAGVFVIRAGKNLHYMWGGMDRTYSRLCPGEAVQWAVIDWGSNEGCVLYDLEGIDPEKNPGTYNFKKRMGGKEVHLSPMCNEVLRPPGYLISLYLNYRTP